MYNVYLQLHVVILYEQKRMYWLVTSHSCTLCELDSLKKNLLIRVIHSVGGLH